MLFFFKKTMNRWKYILLDHPISDFNKIEGGGAADYVNGVYKRDKSANCAKNVACGLLNLVGMFSC